MIWKKYKRVERVDPYPHISHLIQKETPKYWLMVCPFHPDNDPSLSIKKETGYFKCYGCGEHGPAAELLKKLGIEYGEQEERLFRLPKVESDSRRSVTPFKNLEKWPNKNWRGFPPIVMRYLGGKYDPFSNYSLVYELRRNGSIIGYLRCADHPMEDCPSYLTDEWVVEYMWPAHQLKPTKKVVISEGIRDIKACLINGIPGLVNFGTSNSMTEERLNLLRKLGVETVVLFFDPDKAGKKASLRIRKELKDTKEFKVYMVKSWEYFSSSDDLYSLMCKKSFRKKFKSNWRNVWK